MSATILSPSVRSRSTGDPLNWLAEHQLFPKVYWKNAQREVAAAGKLEGSNSCFGGMAFASEPGNDSTWQSFPRSLLFSPAEFCEGKAQVSLEPLALKFARQDTPSREVWGTNVQRALSEIAVGKMQKVVLARKTTLTFEERIDPFLLLRRLLAQSQDRTVFALQLDAHSMFLGATPETLYRREGRKLFTHAVAGTRVGEGLFSCKDEHEWELVRRDIADRLAPLVEHVKQEPQRILQSGHLQHLCGEFWATLKPSISDQEILKALHPTPAVGGLPRETALAYLLKHEPFDRGWYAGPIGWISPESAEMVVGIRSALVSQKKMHLFAGTGIVKGSNEQQEWEELEQKIATFLRL